MRRRVAFIVSLLVPAVARGQELSVTVEGGTEYDSNIHRFESLGDASEGVVGAPVLRLGGRVRGAGRVSPGQVVRYGGFLGSKLFLSADGEDENVAIVAGDLRYDSWWRSRSAVLSGRASYYDAFGLVAADSIRDLSRRNFAVATGEVLLTLAGPDSHRLTAEAGLRDFRYKANADFDWFGEHYGISYQTAVWRGEGGADADEGAPAAIGLRASYRLEQRRYAGPAFVDACAMGQSDPACYVRTELDRVDLNHVAGAEVTYTSARMYRLRYEAQINDSNSVGHSLVRHRLEGAITTELWARWFATFTGVVQLNLFLDPQLVARDVFNQSFVSIDDENRNSLLVHVSRELGPTWTAEARYAWYGNEFATQELAFRRQTGYLGLVCRIR
jgi:hypothetical protein